MTGNVLLERLEGDIARITLDHQAKHNAISNHMWERLQAIFSELSAADGLRCVILTGAGGKAFSAGADISEFEQNRSTIERARAYGKRVNGALSAISECRHPVIAQIQGLCVGGGLELALLCDLRICAQESRFGIPIKRLGLVVAYPEMRALINVVGYANAMEILLEGRIFGSERALQMGLVNRAVAADQLEPHVLETARSIAEGAPLTARWHKKFAKRLQNPAPISAEEFDEAFHCYTTEDFQTGYRSFLSKQRPVFKGK
jgi:enoyl-CoA hydratase/carnithine racemase